MVVVNPSATLISKCIPVRDSRRSKEWVFWGVNGALLLASVHVTVLCSYCSLVNNFCASLVRQLPDYLDIGHKLTAI